MINHDKILNCLSSTPITFRKLAKKMNVKISENRLLSKELIILCNQNKIQQTRTREYYIPKYDKEIEGIIRLNAKGFGFVDLENESFFIPKDSIKTAMDGDKVFIKTYNVPGESKPLATVTKILERNREEFVGEIIKNKYGITIKPFDHRVKGIFIFENKKDIEEGQQVKVKIEKIVDKKFFIKVLKILGTKDDVSMDILIAIEDAMIPYEFDPLTLSEAKKLPLDISNENLEGRTDLRENLIVTIDGDDTKDFDDAIEVKKLENGNYLLGVHIADVTHYVKEGSSLDNEAKIRGTSIYLADRVIPMLPKALSNGICSLNPNVDRFTLSASMEIDQLGNTVKYELYPSIINSKKRLTYKEVNEFYKGNKSFENKNLEDMLNVALELSHIIRSYKQKEGYIDFEIQEAKIIVGEDGKTKDIVARERGESEMLIEDFMVRANETVAFNAFEKELPFVYRVHDKPDSDRVVNLQNVVSALGIEMTIPTAKEPKEFAEAINELKTTRFDDFMKMMMLRTMAKAIYSDVNIGHFGLASQCYTHFTSPIRRYPDLMVHRMTREYFFENNKEKSEHFKNILPTISKHSSDTEQTAADLERKVDDIKKAEYYEQFIGKSFEGIIMSTLKFGFFVEFPNKVDALVHISNLTDGNYELTKDGLHISSGKRKFTVGDTVKVTIIGVAKNEGKIDAVIADQYVDWQKNKNV